MPARAQKLPADWGMKWQIKPYLVVVSAVATRIVTLTQPSTPLATNAG